MRYFIFFLSLLIIAISPFFGQISIDISNIFNTEHSHHMLFWDLRFPRTIIAFFSGAILALGGLIFQTVFRNALTTPFTLGVASGATLGAAIAIIFLPLSFYFLTYVFSFLGAFLTIIILFLLSSKLKGTQTNSLLLIGIALSFFYSAFLMVLYFISDFQQSYTIMRFTMGSLNIVGFNNVYIMSISGLLLLFFILRYKSEFKLLLTSYENAFLKGIEIKKINLLLLISVSLAVGICVSIVGPIGFIGLIIPHLVKMLYKQSAEKLILPVFFYGGVFLVLCDLIARNLGTVSEVPIGVVTSFIGGPFFIYIIIQRRKNS